MDRFNEWLENRSPGAEFFKLGLWGVIFFIGMYWITGSPIEDINKVYTYITKERKESKPASYARSDRENLEIILEAKRQRRDAKVFACERVYTKRDELITCLSNIEVD